MKLFVLFLLVPAVVYSQSNCAKHKDCGGYNSLAVCPKQGFKGDKYLNGQKNRTETPGTILNWKFNDILFVTFYDHWKRGSKRDAISEDETKAVRFTAYLFKIKTYPSGAESSNCNLKFEENNDFHLVLTRTKNEMDEAHSVTAEMTPRTRPLEWTSDKLKSLVKKKAYIRVTGWLMYDTEHAGEDVPARYTHWEIHPVTEFEVCTKSKTQCDSGSGWVKLSNYQL